MYELHQGENQINNISINEHFGMKSIRNEWDMFSMQYVGKTTMAPDVIMQEGAFTFPLGAHLQQFELSIPILIIVFSRTTVKILRNTY